VNPEQAHLPGGNLWALTRSDHASDHPASRIPHPASRIPHPASRIPHPLANAPAGSNSGGLMWFASKEEEVRRIRDEGFAALEARDFDGAIEKGRELLTMRWSGGFELIALGLRAKGDHRGALEALEDAARVAPMWSLSQLRGNVLDELSRHADAVAAYDEALALEGCWQGSVRYNRAVANAALAQWGEALADAELALEDARDAPFTMHALRLAVESLGHLNRHEDAVKLIEHVAAGDGDAHLALSDIQVGAMLAAGRATTEIEALAQRAIEAHVAGLSVARFLHRDGVSAKRVRARVVLRAAAPPNDHEGVIGAFRPATVRAKDEAEALALLIALEPAASRSEAALEVYEVLAEEEGPAEILQLAGRIFFGAE